MTGTKRNRIQRKLNMAMHRSLSAPSRLVPAWWVRAWGLALTANDLTKRSDLPSEVKEVIQ